jgi:hypothetical protein
MTPTRGLIGISLILICSAGVHAQDSAAPVVPVLLTEPNTTVRAPARVQILVNALRYDTDSKSSFALPRFEVEAANPPSSEVLPHGLNAEFNLYAGEVRKIDVQLRAQEGANAHAEAAILEYAAELNALVIASDGQMKNGDAANGPRNVIRFVGNPGGPLAVAATALASAHTWRSVGKLATALQAIQSELQALALDFAGPSPDFAGAKCDNDNLDSLNWNDWYSCVSKPYLDLDNKITNLIQEANSWTPDRQADFEHKAAIIEYWGNVMTGLAAPNFSVGPAQEISARPSRENHAIRVILFDRTSLFSATNTQPTEETFTVTGQGFSGSSRSSGFAVSAGAAFDFKENRQFGIVQSQVPPPGTGSANAFQVTSRSSINPYPILIAHVRIYPIHPPVHWYAFHASFGAGPSIDNQDAGGVSAEFLAGGSLSLRHFMFLTAGVDLKKISALGGDYTTGGPVPTGVTSPPVVSAYKPAFGLAVTFTKP